MVIELFDKPGGFTLEDRRLVAAAADFSSELLRQALAERRTQRLLVGAVGAALAASEDAALVAAVDAVDAADAPLPSSVMDRLKAGFSESGTAIVDADTSIRLAEAVRDLAVRHGPPAVRHCLRVIESVTEMLDANAGV